MNDLTDQLKLSRIPDEEIGLRMGAVILFFAHFYVLGMVIGEMVRYIIDTIKYQLIQNKWHEQSHEQNEWASPFSSAALKMTKQPLRQQLKHKGSIASTSFEKCLFEKKLFHRVVSTIPRFYSKPKGFANA